ncbi:type II toxin-antitoxin system HicB family antitoxin [Chloroflexota bacterium]
MHEEKSIIEFKIEVVIDPDDGGFHAYCPALKGLHTCGDTKEEALQNARDAAIAYLQSLVKHGDPIPVGIIMHRETEGTPTALTKHKSRYTEDLTVACAI